MTNTEPPTLDVPAVPFGGGIPKGVRLFVLMSAIGNKIPEFASVAGYMETKGVPLPSVMLAGAIAFLIFGSISVITRLQNSNRCDAAVDFSKRVSRAVIVLETERLLLRHFNVGDAAFIVELLNDPAFVQHVGDRNVRTLDS